MLPVFLQLGPLRFHTYGLLVGLGLVLGLALYVRLAGRAGLDQARALRLALVVLAVAIAGARLTYAALEWRLFLAQPWRVFYIWQGGLVFYGGLGAAMAVTWWLARRWGLPLLAISDCLAPALALGQALGRLGCLAAGCCYGAPWDGPWAVVFSDPACLARPLDQPLHPVQLYDALGQGLMCLGLLWLWPRRAFAGQVFFAYALLHGLLRLILERFRGDWRGGALLGPFTLTEAFALALSLAAALALVLLWRRARRAGPPAA